MKYILLGLLISLSVFSQDFNKLDENGKKNGLWKGIYEESKRPRYEGTFEHGKEIGMFKFFDDYFSFAYFILILIIKNSVTRIVF